MLAAALVFLAADSTARWRTWRAVTAAGETGRPAPARAVDSPTGYADGRRNQILQSTDGYHWVMQTQQMIATGEWRLRRVDYDNAPEGREVHWCSPLHWWLAAVAWGDHVVTGRPWLVAVEHAALYAGPLLLGLLLLAAVPWAARRLGAWPAALLAAGAVAVVPFSGEFGIGSYDHHGVAGACALLTVLCLVAGLVGEPAGALRAFIASGVAGAAGLWVNAATQIPVLAGLGAGALLALRLVRRDQAAWPPPGLWRTWGLAGGAAALLFYLIEYFPAHLGWRLEVNHPLHALAWMGAGDLLARVGERRWSAGAWISSLALAAPALAVLLAPAQTFVVADKFLWTLHVDYISEYARLATRVDGWESLLVGVNVLPLVALPALWLVWRGGLSGIGRTALFLSLPPALLLSAMAWSQQRWLHVACALWLAVLVGLAALISRAPNWRWTLPRRLAAGVFLALVLLPYPLRAGLDFWRGQTGLSRENIRQFALRDLAFWLRQHSGGGPVTVLAGPTTTTELVYHGGFRGVGTLYWENLAGLRALSEIYGATDPMRALTLIRQHGITHLVLPPWGAFADEAARLVHGLRAGETPPAGAFARELLSPEGRLPDWLRPLPYRLPEAEQFKGALLLVFEVVPNQTPAAAALARARFLAAMGSPAAAGRILGELLSTDPTNAPALITLASLQRTARDRAAHRTTVERLLRLLEADPPLETADRIALAFELAASGRADATRMQATRCWSELSAEGLSRLAPETVLMLLHVTEDFQVAALNKLSHQNAETPRLGSRHAVRHRSTRSGYGHATSFPTPSWRGVAGLTMTWGGRSLDHPSFGSHLPETQHKLHYTMHKSFLKLLAAAVTVAALVASPSAFAQGITTSALGGYVLSKDGSALAGATVSITHEPSGTKATTTTRANGQYNFSGLRVGGPYTVTVTATGYAPETTNDVYLELGDAAVINVTLSSETIQLEKLSVTGSRDGIFGTGRMGTGSSFNENDIDNVSTVRRNVQDIAVLDSRLFLGSLDQGGQLSAQGQNFRFNTFLIDGVQAQDTFGLNSNGFSSLRSPIPVEAIQTLNVELSPYTVKKSGATGAFINAVIKSGTNQFHGSVSYQFTDQDYRAKNPITGAKDTFKERVWTGTLSGPIIKNKLFFSLVYDDFQRKTLPPQANFIPDATQLQAVIDRAKALGYDPGTLNAPDNIAKQKTTVAKLDWNISDKHRAAVTYRKNDGQDVVFAQYTGTTATSLSNFWYAQPRVTESYVGQFFSQWTPDFRTEATVSYSTYDGTPANNGKPFPLVTVQGITGTRLDTGATVTGNVVLGTESSRQLNKITTKETQGKFNAEYSIGNHTITAGVEDVSTKYVNAFVQATNGLYTFSNLANWQAGTPVAAYTLQVPNAGFSINDAVARWRYDAYAAYVEDVWKPNQQLTLLAGLRYDYPYVPEAPPFVASFAAAGFRLPDGRAVTQNNTTNSGNATLAPRVGFTYELKTQRKTQIRGGVGLFQGKSPAVWISNAYSNAGATGLVSVSNPAGFTFNPDPANQTLPSGSLPAPTINVTDPNLRQPAVWKSNIALDHQLPFGNIRASVEFEYLRTEEALHTVFLNYSELGTLPDGRIRYGGNTSPAANFAVDGITSLAQAQAIFGTQTSITNITTQATGAVQNVSAYNATTGVLTFATTNTNGRRRVSTGGPTGTGFADVLYLTNSNKGDGQFFTLSLRRPMKNKWAWSAAYTRSSATEVSPMTSSVALSNYTNRAVYNPNEDVASTSNTEIKDRIVLTLTREFEFIPKFKTTVSAIYQGRTGHTYSWVFRGDANGDGITFNDLFYMPSGPDDPKVTWASNTERDNFFTFANANGLMKYAGQTVPRNSETSPWQQTIDLKIVQQIPLYGKLKGELFCNIINFWNLIDDNWGLQEEVPFAYRRAIVGAVFNSTTNKWVYVHNANTLDGVPITVNDTPVSRWQAQLGVRLKF